MSNHRSATGGRLYRPDRIYRYRVEYVSKDGTRHGVFSETDQPDGGMPYVMAKRTPWVRTATVVANQTAVPLVKRAAA